VIALDESYSKDAFLDHEDVFEGRARAANHNLVREEEEEEVGASGGKTIANVEQG
jgi:hypothetical protein